MKRSVGVWELWGFGVTALLGTVLHFLYEWLGKPIWIAAFSGVNESTWEHMKLLFWPMLIFGIVESFFFRERGDFWCVKLRGMFVGLLSIPILFYTYNGVIGKSPDFVNIAIFFVSAAAAYVYETHLFNKKGAYCRSYLAIGVLLAIGAAFVIFTFMPPHIAIFMDPVTGEYGM